ncbi:hypothetical protein PISMIDRAFT_682391 [Pisolithus microcarpus 441]|uniref:Uncharacterized protein n=1 Tax=Pisolithus microcarpus 441 TaxID=765257 RepID=A0A0C9ZK40_9AGAM|nr:hypothetical protein PISMIDRAFT_682391 [Pisolithus microcarpus 441]
MDTFIPILDLTCDAVNAAGDGPSYHDGEYFEWGQGYSTRYSHISTAGFADALVDAPFPVDHEVNGGWSGIGGFCTVC